MVTCKDEIIRSGKSVPSKAHPIDAAGIAARGVVRLIGAQPAMRHHRPVQPQHVDRRVVAAQHSRG